MKPPPNDNQGAGTEAGHRLSEAAVRLAERVFPDHHSQGALLTVMVLVAVVFFKSVTMVLCTALFFIVHFYYGGAGTFQRPIRKESRPGALDVLLVTLGLAALGGYAGIALVHAAGWVITLARWAIG